MESTDLIQKLYIKLLKFIALKARTEGETKDRIFTYLQKFKDLSNEEKTSISVVLLQQLKEENLINDSSYVRDYINVLTLTTKPQSPNSIKQLLIKKHLPRESIDKILSSIQGDAHRKAAFTLATKKLRSYSRYPSSQIKPRLTSFLMSKGFDYDTVLDVIEELIV